MSPQWLQRIINQNKKIEWRESSAMKSGEEKSQLCQMLRGGQMREKWKALIGLINKKSMWRSGDISEKFKVQNGDKEVERSSERFQRAGGKERKAGFSN